MWCHGARPKSAGSTSEPSLDKVPDGAISDDDKGRLGAAWRGRARALLLAGGLASAPHIPCLLGVGGVGISGYLGYRSVCGHADPNPLEDVTLRRLDSVPQQFEEFSSAAAAQAATRLLDAQPGLYEVMAAKREEAAGATIQVVVVENQQDGCVVVGICKDGMLCPCSRPQFFDAGRFEDLRKPETYPGQHLILNALYNSDGSRR